MVIIRHLEDPANEKNTPMARNPNTVAVKLSNITKSTEIIFSKLSPSQSYNPILVRRASQRRPFVV